MPGTERASAAGSATYTTISSGGTEIVGSGGQEEVLGGTAIGAVVSSAGRDQFAFFNQGAGGPAHTITITDFMTAGGITQNLVFVDYGFNTDDLRDSNPLSSGPQQQVVDGSNHIALSDGTTIILQDFDQTTTFSHWNAWG